MFIVIETCHLGTTVATLVFAIHIRLGTTVDELLLREGNKFSRFYKVGTLEDSNCGKGPACSAMCLVFDWGNSTSLYPIYVIGKIGLV